MASLRTGPAGGAHRADSTGPDGRRALSYTGLEALVGLGLLDDPLALDLRKPQDYFHRVWSTAFRAADLADAGQNEGEYSDTCTADDNPEQDIA